MLLLLCIPDGEVVHFMPLSTSYTIKIRKIGFSGM
jgi:hypothetical protein